MIRNDNTTIDEKFILAADDGNENNESFNAVKLHASITDQSCSIQLDDGKFNAEPVDVYLSVDSEHGLVVQLYDSRGQYPVFQFKEQNRRWVQMPCKQPPEATT